MEDKVVTANMIAPFLQHALHVPSGGREGGLPELLCCDAGHMRDLMESAIVVLGEVMPLPGGIYGSWRGETLRGTCAIG